MQQDCPFGAFPPFEVPPTGCCWGIQQSCRPRARTSQTLLHQHLLRPQPRWCSTGKISPARVLGLRRFPKNFLYHRDSAKRSQRTSHHPGLLLHLPHHYHHFHFRRKLCLLVPAHSLESYLHCWLQLCLFQMSPASHWRPPHLSWRLLPLQPGNVQNSEQLPPHLQTPPGLWCCLGHTWEGITRKASLDPREHGQRQVYVAFVRLQVNLHVQCTLGLGCFLPTAIANQSTALGQAEVEGQQGTMLHADSPQCGAIDLNGRNSSG